MEKRGHQFEIWAPKARFFNLPFPKAFKKWMGYIDQFILFPMEVKKRMKLTNDAIFVFSDNALGPWVPLVAARPHVIHCHDFMAQNSGLGNIAENKVSWTGRKYQAYIRKGYSKGKNFISVSQKTKVDLHKILNKTPQISEVVYNGLNPIFKPLDSDESRIKLSKKFNIDLNAGYIMHLGGNVWYKNRIGVVELYNAWRNLNRVKLPLLLIGEPGDFELNSILQDTIYKEDIFILSGVDDQTIHKSYSGASLFLFPSLEEGFGWPIAEAMACGCPVITTGEAPMNEVGGDAAIYIPKKPVDNDKVKYWAAEAAIIIENVLTLSGHQRKDIVESGIKNIDKFDLEKSMDKVEGIYQKILSTQK